MNETEFDVLVVGAGTAGMPCAIGAAERGLRVCVVEKLDRVGGTLHVTGGDLSAAGTRRQAARGIVDSPQAHFEDIDRISRGTVDEVVTRLAVEEAARTVDWLEDNGYTFADAAPAVLFGHEPYDVPRTHFAPRRGLEILDAMLPDWDRLVASGAIVLLTGSTLRELVTEDGGRVAGVVVDRADGPREIRAANVVLATGGYAANPEMFAEVTPRAHRLVSCAPETSQGDGIVAARKVGAAFVGADKHLPTADGIETAAGSGRAELLGAWPVLHDPLRLPREIYVDPSGRRFMNEEELSPDTRERNIRQLDDTAWFVVFDDASIDVGLPLVPFWGPDGLREKAREGDVAWVGDTPAELARKAGIDPEGLEATIAEFNASVPHGRDLFGRRRASHTLTQGPFYALRNVATVFITFGGLAVDGDLRVLTEAGEPIEGLYAAGEVIGAAATTGNAFCSGMLVTPALSFGRVLGRTLTGRGA